MVTGSELPTKPPQSVAACSAVWDHLDKPGKISSIINSSRKLAKQMTGINWGNVEYLLPGQQKPMNNSEVLSNYTDVLNFF